MHRRNQRGQALVEFALASFALLLLLFGILELGRAVYIYNAMTNAAREGARYGVVALADATFEQDIKNRVKSLAVALGLTDNDITVTCVTDGGAAGQQFCSPYTANSVRVQIDYRFRSLVRLVPLNLNLRAVATMRIESMN